MSCLGQQEQQEQEQEQQQQQQQRFGRAVEGDKDGVVAEQDLPRQSPRT